MIIYKITNKENNKVYIGQTIRTLQQRFNRHKNDALHNILNTHFARAIREYGPDAFIAEVIDTAETQEELNKKEQYWIQYYNSINNGYNETDAIEKCGGNTYQSKTSEEMKIIGKKISESKMGGKNPQAVSVKCKSVKTGEELHFTSQAEMRDYFKEKNHQFISRRCLGKIQCLYKNEWMIAFENQDYNNNFTQKGKTPKRGRELKIIDLINNKEYYFHSLRELERDTNIKPNLPGRQIISEIAKGLRPQIKNYYITFVN